MFSWIASKSNSVYITAMEYGHKLYFEGISYNELKSHVEKVHRKNFTFNAEMAFVVWFLDSFTSVETPAVSRTNLLYSIQMCLRTEYLKQNIDISHHSKTFIKFKREYKFYLTGESYRKYLEYQELQEARSNSKQAFFISLIAIGISLVGIIASPILEFYLNQITN